MRIGLVQMNTQRVKADNLAAAERLIESLVRKGARLIMLPEYFNYLGPEKQWRKHAEELYNSLSLGFIQNLAMRHGVYIHCGSMLERRDGEIHNTGVVFNSNGDLIAKYRKIHLFDVEVPGGRRYFESETLKAGETITTFTIDNITFGMATCYDLRFPEMFRALSAAGAQVFLVPAAFTMMTGKDHWELLLRARAVENLCYVAAADQYGSSPPSHVSFGRSMVVDPWGVVIAQASDGVTTLTADIDLDRLNEIRKTFPALEHVRKDLFGVLSGDA